MKPLLPRCSDSDIGVIGHVIADYPDQKTCRQMLAHMGDVGVSLVELQIPFSEPMADGPLFLAANHEALKRGVKVSDAFSLMKEMAPMMPPMVFMTYGNIVFRYGYDAFVSDARAAGCRGVIIPDLSFDAASEFYHASAREQLAQIVVVPPNVSEQRLSELCQSATGFIYVMARAGVTGRHTEVAAPLLGQLARIRKHTELPLAVGFGITTKQDIDRLRGHADYAIVGSQSLRSFQQGGLEGFKQFWQKLM